MEIEKPSFVIIGGGPAGLTAAYEVTKHGGRPVVLERTEQVGGLARTENYKGYHFDMGGHRFFTKAQEVKQLWAEVLGDQFLRRPRLSRIFYRGKFFFYPLKPLDALMKLGPIEAVLIVLSYVRWQIAPHRREDTFEQWVTNRFGQRLFLTFFKTYTEKVWGIPCSELKAEWAAQRIKNLSVKAILQSFVVKTGTKITTLIEEFDYPRLGPGMMWKAFQARIEERGGSVHLNADVVKIRWDGKDRITGVVVGNGPETKVFEGTNFISSMPVSEFVKRLDPPPPPGVLEGAAKLNYRDFLTVCLIVNKKQLFDDNWIYIHDSRVQVGRIQNFKNWSPEMVPDASRTSLGLEYFCNMGDSLWTMADADLVELGKRELNLIGLASYGDVEDGCVFRAPYSYPVYDSEYRGHLDAIKSFMNGLTNCQTIGRSGLHRYNNQDHSMLTALYAVRNVYQAEKNDLWDVNTDEEYHEEIVETAIARVFQKIDPVAMGAAVGSVVGLAVFLATLFQVVKGEIPASWPNLWLLANYFPGYRVSAAGSLLGLLYGAFVGFLAGETLARVTNMAAFTFKAILRGRMTMTLLRRFLDEV